MAEKGNPKSGEGKDNPLIVEDLRFISKFKHYDDEACGIKPYTIRDFTNLNGDKKDKIKRFMAGEIVLTVTLTRGYTSECIRQTVAHALLWKDKYGDVILSWNPNERSLI